MPSSPYTGACLNVPTSSCLPASMPICAGPGYEPMRSVYCRVNPTSHGLAQTAEQLHGLGLPQSTESLS